MNVTPVVLEGAWVRLEPLEERHFEALFRHAEPSLFEHYLDWPDDASYAAFARWMGEDLTARGCVPFAVVSKETGEAIGSSSYLDIRPSHRTLEIGSTWYGRAHQGTKVNPECKLLMLEYAFEVLGAVRVQLKTSSENLRSQRAIAKLGAVREGILRNYQMRKNGRPRDTVMFSITPAEWPKLKAGLRERLGQDARGALLSLLERHAPQDEKERADLEAMVAHARALEAPLSRAQATAHFTGSAVVVTADGGRVCLIHHGKLHRWLQPGGHSDEADFGAMELSALREAREETGLNVTLHPGAPRPLDVDVHAIPERKGEPGHQHLDVRYLVVAHNPDALAHDPNESHGAQWLSWDDALARADEAPLRRLLMKARAFAQRR